MGKEKGMVGYGVCDYVVWGDGFWGVVVKEGMGEEGEDGLE